MWSVYLLTIRWASRPGPGRPLAIGIAGLGAVVTTSQGSKGRHAGSVAWGRWSWSVGGWPGPPGSGRVWVGPATGITADDGGASWGVGWGAGMGWDSWPGCASCAGARSRCLLQHGQTYLWTKCSTTNNDAGR